MISKNFNKKIRGQFKKSIQLEEDLVEELSKHDFNQIWKTECNQSQNQIAQKHNTNGIHHNMWVIFSNGQETLKHPFNAIYIMSN